MPFTDFGYYLLALRAMLKTTIGAPSDAGPRAKAVSSTFRVIPCKYKTILTERFGNFGKDQIWMSRTLLRPAPTGKRTNSNVAQVTLLSYGLDHELLRTRDNFFGEWQGLFSIGVCMSILKDRNSRSLMVEFRLTLRPEADHGWTGLDRFLKAGNFGLHF